MSELRATILNKANRQATNSIKASGDTVIKKKCSQQKTLNSIPKNLRYDLENALVGLCDVWFEEIKPYLVRNNIKVHVHADGGDGDREHPPASRECSHNDPASSAGSCKLCRLLFNAANSIESAVSQAASAGSLCAGPVGGTSPRRNSKKETVRKPHGRRKCRERTEPRRLVPRLCRTYSAQPCTEPPKPQRNTNRSVKVQKRSATSSFPNTLNPFLPEKKRFTKRDTSTQTETLIVNVRRGSRNKGFSDSTAKFQRLRSTATILPPGQNIRRSEDPLFKDDVIDMIAEKYDKKLKVLYTSPRREDYPSVMNLYSPSKCRRTSRGVHINKVPPWK